MSEEIEKEYLSARQVAAMVGIKRATFTAYASRGQAPEPDLRLDTHPYWKRETIRKWREESGR